VGVGREVLKVAVLLVSNVVLQRYTGVDFKQILQAVKVLFGLKIDDNCLSLIY
jgi:hypothetical protein